MIDALAGFVGGATFRMIFAGVGEAWKVYSERRHELKLLELQGRLDIDRHQRDLEMIKLQHDQGVQIVRVKGDLEVQQIDAEAFLAVMKQAHSGSGIWIIDFWNGIIRPAFATFCGFLLYRHFQAQHWALTDTGEQLVGSIVGFFFADRTLLRRSR